MRSTLAHAALSGAAITTAALLGTASVAPAVAAEGSTAPQPPPAASIDQVAQEYLDATGVPGITITVVRDGEVVHAEGYGHDSEGSGVTSTTPIPVASVAKSMTAASILRLVEEGLIDLDEPVSDQLLAYDPVDERAESITVRQLLNQTSGLGSNGLLSPHRQRIDSAEEAVAVLSGMDLVDDPGARHVYFNGNYWLLAALAEEVTGNEFHEHMNENLFGPLGMDGSTTFDDPGGGGTGGAAKGHFEILGTALTHPGTNELRAGDGGVATTAEDLGRWLVPFTNQGRAADGETFLTEEAVDEALTASAPEGVYAFGWREFTGADEDRPRVTHAGTGRDHLAHQGIYFDRQYAVGVMANTLTAPVRSTDLLASDVVDLVEGGEPEPMSRTNLWADLTLLALGLLSVGLAVRRWFKAPQWAERHRRLPRWRTILALAPRVLPAALFVGFMLILLAAGISFGSMLQLFIWPMLTVWALVVILAQFSTVPVRLRHLRRVRMSAALTADAAESGPVREARTGSP